MEVAKIMISIYRVVAAKQDLVNNKYPFFFLLNDGVLFFEIVGRLQN